MFTLTINTDGAAFGDEKRDCNYELARILRQVADHLECGSIWDTIVDANGNVVGRYEQEGY